MDWPPGVRREGLQGALDAGVMVGVNICSALPPCPWYPRWERWTGRGRGCLSHDGCGIRSVPPAHGTQEGRVGQGEKGQKWGEVQFSAPCPQEPRSGICREQQMLGSRWVECKSVLCFPPAPAQLPESHRGRMLGRRALWPRATPLSDQASEGKKKSAHSEALRAGALLVPSLPGSAWQAASLPRAQRRWALGWGRGGAGRGGLGGGRWPRGLAGMRGREGRARPRNGQGRWPVGTRHGPLWPITARWAGLPPEGGVGAHRGRGARGAPDN